MWQRRKKRRMRRRMRSASRSVQFFGTQGVTAEEEVPRWYLIWQTLCCDSDYSEVYAHPFSHLPLATEEWTEENRGTLGVSTFKDQQHQGWCSCPPADEVWCLKAVISPAICWHYHLTLLTSWWVGKQSVLVSVEKKWLQCVVELLEVS